MKNIVENRSAEYSQAVSKYIVMPHHTNPNGLMFGGVLMSWMDMTAALVAEKHSGMDVATIHIEDIHFQHPIKIGEHVTVTATLVSTGNTSMKIDVSVISENVKLGQKKHTTNAVVTFVAIDENMKPCSVPKLLA